MNVRSFRSYISTDGRSLSFNTDGKSTVFVSWSRYKLLLMLALFLLLSCTSGKPAPTGPRAAVATQSSGQASGAYELEITPHDPTRKSTLKLAARGFALSEASVTWFVNDGMVLGSGQNEITASETSRGDTVQARAMLHNQEIRSNVVQIGNTPPEIDSIRLLPAVFKPGDKLHVEVTGRDVDGDAVSFLYAWSKNGSGAGTGDSLELPVKRGDKISVKITPFDGQSYGDSLVVEREIVNTPPLIIDHNEFGFDGKVYTYQVKASDPDGDPLTYTIESPAEGMAIDKSSGLMTWNVPTEFHGKQSVSIVVADGHGGSAHYSLEITIR